MRINQLNFTLKNVIAHILAFLRGTQYKVIDGHYWVKEPGKDWEMLMEHLRKEHQDEYIKIKFKRK